MLTALRRRLTLLMTALTSLVLAGALVVTWNYAAAQYRTAAETLLILSDRDIDEYHVAIPSLAGQRRQRK